MGLSAPGFAVTINAGFRFLRGFRGFMDQDRFVADDAEEAALLAKSTTPAGWLFWNEARNATREVYVTKAGTLGARYLTGQSDPSDATRFEGTYAVAPGDDPNADAEVTALTPVEGSYLRVDREDGSDLETWIWNGEAWERDDSVAATKLNVSDVVLSPTQQNALRWEEGPVASLWKNTYDVLKAVRDVFADLDLPSLRKWSEAASGRPAYADAPVATQADVPPIAHLEQVFVSDSASSNPDANAQVYPAGHPSAGAAVPDGTLLLDLSAQRYRMVFLESDDNFNLELYGAWPGGSVQMLVRRQTGGNIYMTTTPGTRAYSSADYGLADDTGNVEIAGIPGGLQNVTEAFVTVSLNCVELPDARSFTEVLVTPLAA